MKNIFHLMDITGMDKRFLLVKIPGNIITPKWERRGLTVLKKFNDLKDPGCPL